ncbi:hypothetical protein B0H13DRAFT_1850794 [Mycena leptocephala]|nr:hypothetical protein B0H13DRAFT_1850794 [Mycena leptocephala]
MAFTEAQATGEIKLVSLKRGQMARDTHSLKSTSAARALNYRAYSLESIWNKCAYVISESLDKCFIDSWVFARCPIAETSWSILAKLCWSFWKYSQVLSSRDDIYGMPVLHDCHSAKCEATGVRLRMQERVESDQTDKYIVHQPLDRFIINTHAFHNAHLLRAALPRDLVAPIPIFPDREAKHHELATQLREQLTNCKVAAATKKRKRSEEDDDADNESGERRQRKTREAPKRQKTSGAVPPSKSMVANRPKRQINPTEKAALEPDSEEAGSSSDDSDEGYNDSDGDFSD